MLYEFGGLIFRGAYTWRGLVSEFYGMTLTFLKRMPLKKVLTFTKRDKDFPIPLLLSKCLVDFRERPFDF